ncbi:IS4 family transposase [Thomasclavelia cocleata]|uniref:IS4 family transposase n=1 Tax=Thomasclavelia cocleata TaxID=69824 RepID=UPI002572B866|nr:IS4 family transposase [Thomasclavelia cocleata]
MDNSRSLFVENPDTDFIRNRKLDFSTVINNIISMEAGSLKDELLKLNDYSIDTPTASAFIQARNKIKVDAFKSLFNNFNKKTSKLKSYKGYRLLAVDGSEEPIDNTFRDKETTVRNCNHLGNSYSAFHINASYDLLECTYDDIIIQGEAEKNENGAFNEIVDRYNGPKAIFIADRNYESYNSFEHVVHSGNKYLIRVKDITSSNNITRSLGPFPDTDEFDIDVSRILTIKQTNEIRKNPQIYKFIPANQRFDYLSKDKPFYDFQCRTVRIKITEDTYECIITSLDRDEFSMEDIKELYNKRWGIETSFRQVKYAIGLHALHSKKRKLIKQEIYARLLLYNFCQRIVQDIKIVKKKTKYTYQVNFTKASHIIRRFLNKKTSGKPPVENLIAKEILPVRPGRTNTRHVSAKKVVCFNYRFD